MDINKINASVQWSVNGDFGNKCKTHEWLTVLST